MSIQQGIKYKYLKSVNPSFSITRTCYLNQNLTIYFFHFSTSKLPSYENNPPLTFATPSPKLHNFTTLCKILRYYTFRFHSNPASAICWRPLEARSTILFHLLPDEKAAPARKRMPIGARVIYAPFYFPTTWRSCLPPFNSPPPPYTYSPDGGTARLVGGNKHVVRGKLCCDRFIPHKIVNCISDIDLW